MKKILALIILITSFAVICGLPPTTSQLSGDASKLTTFNYLFPNFTGTHTGTTVSLDTLGIAGGGTGSVTQNFVDLTTDQTVVGRKSFSSNAAIGITAQTIAGAPTLQVFSNTNNFPMLIERELDSSGGNSLALRGYMVSAASTSPAPLSGSGFIFSNARGTKASPTDVVVGDRLGYLIFSGYSSGTPRNTAAINASVDTGTVSATSMPTYMNFMTTPDGSVTRTERMRIDKDGNVGVGTTPNANIVLDVASTTKAFSPPRMTTAQKNAIATPLAGMQVFDTDLASPAFYDGAAWKTGLYTTGTAANITATSNNTITTLSALSLPLSQTTGTLSLANGGTGSVNLGTGILKVAGGVFATGSISLTSDVSGILPIASGGTNAITAAAAITSLGAVDNSTNQTIAGNKYFSGNTFHGNSSAEQGGVNIGGISYIPTVLTSDVAGTNHPPILIHRHSTTLSPGIWSARANSDTTSHAAVTNGQSVFDILGSGAIDTSGRYDKFAQISFLVSTSNSASITSGSSPGKIALYTTADASSTPSLAMSIDNDQSASFIKPIHGTLDDNLFINPYFEGSASAGLAIGWTNGTVASAATASITTTQGEFSEGSQAQKIAIATGTLSFYQTVTIATGSSVQYVIGGQYRVPSNFTDFQVCTIVNGAEKTCVPSANLILADKFYSIEIPEVVTPGQNAGIKFKTTTSSTGNIFIDKTYIKQGIGTQALQLDNWYTVAIASNGTSISNQNVSGWAASSSFSSTGVLDVVPASGKFTVVPNCQITADDTSSTSLVEVRYDKANSTTSLLRFHTGLAAIATNIATIIHCDKQGNDYLNASSAIYSQASANYDWTSYSVAIAGTASAISCKHRRLGGDLEMSCNGNIGAVSGTLASITLPNSLTIDTSKISASNTTAAAGQSVGYLAQTTTNNRMEVVTATGTSTSLVYFGDYFGHAGGNYLIPQLANTALTGSTVTSVYFKVPISGWSNSASIVGSFVDYVSTQGSRKFSIQGVDFYTTALGTPCTTAGPCLLANYYGVSTWVNSIAGDGGGNYTVTLNTSYWKDVTKVRCSLKHNVPTIAFMPAFTLPNSSGVFTMGIRYNNGVYTEISIAGTLECIGAIN